jgi:hypothetical protein
LTAGKTALLLADLTAEWKVEWKVWMTVGKRVMMKAGLKDFLWVGELVAWLVCYWVARTVA